jgi:hypothetical protein
MAMSYKNKQANIKNLICCSFISFEVPIYMVVAIEWQYANNPKRTTAISIEKLVINWWLVCFEWWNEKLDKILLFKDEAQTALFKDPVRTVQ